MLFLFLFHTIFIQIHFDIYVVLQCDVPEGALVPKSLYKEEYMDRSPDEQPLNVANSLYQTAHIIKDYPHEVCHQIM
jgi:hypothetical protein